ncbi:hypothetical protein BCR34DRAFT_54309 [Clohesyomyces aquaticus]|uniref:Uncharacterized protein n=1 Tax=Clohesyomyces aquaticus TaxID=1231657 RepID=A0A1Y1Z3A2_9PLEO|nr:hypothetical protein BCR34DRAFT_54309 [Clohesyomyces aquaticus]
MSHTLKLYRLQKGPRCLTPHRLHLQDQNFTSRSSLQTNTSRRAPASSPSRSLCIHSDFTSSLKYLPPTKPLDATLRHAHSSQARFRQCLSTPPHRIRVRYSALIIFLPPLPVDQTPGVEPTLTSSLRHHILLIYRRCQPYRRRSRSEHLDPRSVVLAQRAIEAYEFSSRLHT